MIREFVARFTASAVTRMPGAMRAPGSMAFADPGDFQHRMTQQAEFGETDA